MTQVIYYAHCVADYGSQREKKDIRLIHKLWPDATVINPAVDTREADWVEKGMAHFDDLLVELEIDMVVFRGVITKQCIYRQRDLAVTAGTFYEAKAAHRAGLPVVELPYLYKTCRLVLDRQDTNLHIKAVKAEQDDKDAES